MMIMMVVMIPYAWTYLKPQTSANLVLFQLWVQQWPLRTQAYAELNRCPLRKR